MADYFLILKKNAETWNSVLLIICQSIMSDSIITEEFESHRKKFVKWTNHIHLTNDSEWENVLL